LDSPQYSPGQWERLVIAGALLFAGVLLLASRLLLRASLLLRLLAPGTAQRRSHQVDNRQYGNNP
jgi:hypothetical protein